MSADPAEDAMNRDTSASYPKGEEERGEREGKGGKGGNGVRGDGVGGMWGVA